MGDELFNLYWILVASGLFLLAIEFFIPGGIIGIFGVFGLLGAAIVGFAVFGAKGGLISALSLVVGATVFLALWIKYCPRSFLGNWFTLKTDGRDFKSFDDDQQRTLIGKSGVAHSDLRPAGMALIDGKKIDVVSEAGFIPHGSSIKVIDAAGSRIVVRQVDAA